MNVAWPTLLVHPVKGIKGRSLTLTNIGALNWQGVDPRMKGRTP